MSQIIRVKFLHHRSRKSARLERCRTWPRGRPQSHGHQPQDRNRTPVIRRRSHVIAEWPGSPVTGEHARCVQGSMQAGTQCGRGELVHGGQRVVKMLEAVIVRVRLGSSVWAPAAVPRSWGLSWLKCSIRDEIDGIDCRVMGDETNGRAN